MVAVNEKRTINPAEDAAAEKDLPSVWAAALSYATLSRYADIALRSFAYSTASYDDFGRAGTSSAKPDPSDSDSESWRSEAMIVLLMFLVALPGVAVLVLKVQGSRCWGRIICRLRPRL